MQILKKKCISKSINRSYFQNVYLRIYWKMFQFEVNTSVERSHNQDCESHSDIMWMKKWTENSGNSKEINSDEKQNGKRQMYICSHVCVYKGEVSTHTGHGYFHSSWIGLYAKEVIQH